MSHIEKRRNLWYGTMKIPPHLHERMGRTKFLKSLGTPDKRKAQVLVLPLIALWKAELREAEGEPDALRVEALRWRSDLAEATVAATMGTDDGHKAFIVEDHLADRTRTLEGQIGEDKAHEFYQVATGKATHTADHLIGWEASIVHLAEKTQDQMKKDVRKLTGRFATVQGITSKSMRDWTRELCRGTEAVTPASLKRLMQAWRSFWAYLVRQDVAPPDLQPFVLVEAPSAATKSPKGKAKGWTPFPPAEVPKLVTAARQRKDEDLAHLIILGAHSGARIEELCSLKVEEVGPASFHITDAKTEAGVREVPIHPAIKGLVKSLCESSKDGYLISGLTFNKYGDRSNAIGKRFGRLKDSLGHGPSRVFHSLRKTLVTMLEDAGISENLAADIVGHEKPRITYGLYSGGSSLSTKAKALSMVSYPGLTVY